MKRTGASDGVVDNGKW